MVLTWKKLCKTGYNQWVGFNIKNPDFCQPWRKNREALQIQKHPDNLNRDSGRDNVSRIWKTALLKLRKISFSQHMPSPPFPPSLQRLHKESFPKQQYQCAPCPDKVNDKVHETLALVMDEFLIVKLSYLISGCQNHKAIYSRTKRIFSILKKVL